ncbi:MAG: SpvB/TcaC N-terminal domain-containing protein [Pseudonocardia sp.]
MTTPGEREPSRLSPPAISLPKGGGAIRGMTEKFTANPVNGTGALTVPIALSPGRSGFGPELALSYDSGSGNGPFGFGWSLGLAAITRKTDKGLPRYDDDGESDVFLLSGAEDLVPVLRDDGTLDDSATDPRFRIRRYRPRVEGLFACVERWTLRSDPADVHWRTLSRDNVLTLYGRTAGSRITDPADPTRIFSWLICESRDTLGNAVVYGYLDEDDVEVDRSAVHERNRGDGARRAARYLGGIRYGNRRSLLDAAGERPRFVDPHDIEHADWCFEVVLDYGAHDLDAPTPRPVRAWPVRADPFSDHRAGFEVRTYRLCRRILVFHHFDNDPDVREHPLVRSTELAYRETPVASFVRSVTQHGHRRDGDGYLRRSLPRLDLTYSEARLDPTVHVADAENLPAGVDGSVYRFADLDGEGISGVLVEEAGTWLYLAPEGGGRFGPVRPVARRPAIAALSGGRQQLLDLAGDGSLDLVELDGPTPGVTERTTVGGWSGLRPFRSRPVIDWDGPDVRFVDLDGNGLADVLRGGDQELLWHRALGEDGFGAANRVRLPHDELRGPRTVCSDGVEQLHLADMCGDGLADLVRIRNGEVCYWPNLGHGRFGPMVTMDRAPRFDRPDQFTSSRLRLADIDGSGTTDLIYLGRGGVDVYLNQAGNGWSGPHRLAGLPPVDDVAAVTVTDLLGNGTACLVWSSPLPNDRERPLRYVDLMGGVKPHLLTRVVNNLGAQTHIRYRSSTEYHLDDKAAGRPWRTRLPFPVHVVERVETQDQVGRSRFVSSYAYHDGYFDGHEREFRGFAMVEQRDTETFGALSASGAAPAGNIDAATHVPPVLTRTWFHTGAPPDVRPLDNAIAGGLTAAEEREAHRALKGSMLRREVYALDGHPQRAAHPYVVTEQSFAVRQLQPRGDRRHGVFLAFPAESVTSHYERNPADPRVVHTLTLEVDEYGNVVREATAAYARRTDDATLPHDEDRERQRTPLVTCTRRRFTDPVQRPDDHHTPLPAEVLTYELTGLVPPDRRLRPDDLLDLGEEIGYEERPTAGRQHRLVHQVRTLYRSDDLEQLGGLESRALPGETYTLAFTPELLAAVFRREGEDLVPDAAALLGAEGGYVDLDGDGRWWVPSGREFLSPDDADTAADELAYARTHFFRTCRFRDPFGSTTTVRHDDHDLLVLETRDPVGNRTTAGERAADGTVTPAIDYRVLQPSLVTDPNGNRSEVAFDALGLVAGTAVLDAGDSLEGFVADLEPDVLQEQLDDPLADPHAVLGSARTRLLYDVLAHQRTGGARPAVAATLAREVHGDVAGPVQRAFAYSDGFGREIQKKIRAEPGPVPVRGPDGRIVLDAEGRPTMTDDDVEPRWVGSGWTVVNNKGEPVRRFEPFFTDTHRHEFDVRIGVGPILFYDPVGRVVVTLQPDRTYEKVVVDAWRRVAFDRNDTVAPDGGHPEHTGDPRTDPDTAGYVQRWFATRPDDWQTWWQRRDGVAGAEGQAAVRAAVHTNTPTSEHLDVLGRPFLTVRRNRLQRDGPVDEVPNRVELDIEDNQRAVRDALVPGGRTVLRQDHDLAGGLVRTRGMDTGRRWMLNDVGGRPVRSWDERGHAFRTGYDPARRPVRTYVNDRLTERIVYGEQHPDGAAHNLRGRSWLQLDQAGAATTDRCDAKGNVTATTRRVTTGYADEPDWSAVDALVPADATVVVDGADLDDALGAVLEAEAFTTTTAYDALDRVTALTAPDTSVVRPGYNAANLLERVDVDLPALDGGAPVRTPFVTDIDYDANGRRERIVYAAGAGVTTTYTYDWFTKRLSRLTTRREAAAFPEDCPEPSRAGWPGCGLQDLRYTYDPVGNLTHIVDAAQQAIFFRNARVEPSSDYTYDALYRLVEATGREHLGQGGAPIPHSAHDAARIGLPHPGDGTALGTYTESYAYDAVDNLLLMRHDRTGAAATGWTRAFTRDEPSRLGDGQVGNRLSTTTLAAAAPQPCHHDAHGNMTRLPHLGGVDPEENAFWDHRDRLRRVELGGGGTAHYTYDGAGQRVRKVWEKAPGLVEERVYVGGFEVFRRRNGDGHVRFRRTTLHVTDGGSRLALVETRTLDEAGTDQGPQRLTRLQLGNHLGSAVLELDDRAAVISYEEYSPYGSTTYQAVRSQTEAPRRYRYTGKERDEESGLCYHGARYYAPWLARWVSPDPAGLVDGPNLYAYVRDNPIRLRDPSGRQAMPAAVAEAWAAAEKSGYDSAGVERLILAYEGARGTSGQQLVTSQSALEYATVRASAAVANWDAGNYGTAVAHGGLAVVESFGHAIFGTTHRETARNAVIMAVVGRVLGKIAQAGRTAQLEVQASRTALEARVAARGAQARIATQPQAQPAASAKPAPEDPPPAPAPAERPSILRPSPEKGAASASQQPTADPAPPTAEPPIEAGRQLYRIGEGVRRSVAAQEAGQADILAEVMGTPGRVRIPLADLLSPKASIPRDTRFLNALRGMMTRDPAVPPIEVTPVRPGAPTPGLTPVPRVRLTRWRPE